MKIVQIVHNPTAGNSRHSRADLIELVEDSGSLPNYVSTDEEGWEGFYRNKSDAIFLAGGDGTVHKMARVLLKNITPGKHLPIHLLPLGTANNIAKTLDIARYTKPDLKKTKCEIRYLDCGKVQGLENVDFFLESVGIGIFPLLIEKMQEKEITTDDPEEKLQKTLKVLLKIVKDFKAQKAKIKGDGISIRGSFLLVELMNIKYIGPNFELAPNADPGDGFFELVMIPEKNREDLIDYLKGLISGRKERPNLEKFIKILRVKKLKLKCQPSKIHVDDILINDYSGEKIKMKVIPNALEFIKST